MTVDKRTRRYRLGVAMRECGVVRSDDVSFGRPRVQGSGIPCAVLADRFRGGDTMDDIAEDYGLTRDEVERAIRFVMLYPRSDLPSFWTDPHTTGECPHHTTPRSAETKETPMKGEGT